MSTIAMKRSIEMNHTNVNEETGLIAASAVMMTGNSYGAAQIMKTVRR